jgi:hypothetical protein
MASGNAIEKMKPSEIYRDVVPDSDYEECKGCHVGTVKCPYVHTLHKNCPCTGCLVKTSCTDYCIPYQNSIAIESVKSKKIKVSNLNNKGYDIKVKKGKVYISITVRLWRWLEK